MQALIDAAVMIVAMVVPTLRRQFLEEGLHFLVLVGIRRFLETRPSRCLPARNTAALLPKRNQGKVSERRHRPAFDQVGRDRVLGPVFKALPLEL